MKRTLSLTLAILGMVFTFPSFAQTIFDDTPSSAPVESKFCTSTFSGTFNGAQYTGSLGGASSWMVAQFNPTGTLRDPREFGHENLVTDPENGNCSATAVIIVDLYRSADHTVPMGTSKYRMSMSAEIDSFDKCPDEDPSFTSKSFPKQRDDELRCYSPMDLAENDTCPTSFGEDRGVLPNTSQNPPPKICSLKEDGSRCLYTYDSANDVYFSDLENLPDCYINDSPPFPEIDPPTQDPENPECVYLGNNTRACQADPTQVCTNGICQQGCGSVNGIFVCLGNPPNIDKPDPYEPPLPPQVDCEIYPHYQQCQTDQPQPINCELNPTHPSCGGDVQGYCFENPNDAACNPTFGGGGVPVKIDMTETNSLLTQIKGELQKKPPHKTSDQLESSMETLTNETLEKINETLNQTPEEAGATFLEASDTGDISSAFGAIPVSQCQNPVLFNNHTLEICHRVPQINEFLYWIVAALTVLFVYGELNTAFRIIN